MLRVGIVGAGRVAQIAHVATLARVPDATVLAIADLREELARAVAARWGIARVYRSHAALIADPDVDAVVVVTQRTQTAAVAHDALAAGKHVLSEKPMALSTTDAAALVALAGARDLTYAVGYMKRHDDGVRRARAWAGEARERGTAGALLAVRAGMDGGDDGAGTDWLMTAEPRRDAGFTVTAPVADTAPRSAFDRFLNVFSHTTNLVRFVAGAPIVLGRAARTADGVTLAGTVADADFTASFAERAMPGWNEWVELRFERATLRIALPAPFAADGYAVVTVVDAAGDVRDLSEPGWAFARQAAAFVRDVRERRVPIASGADAVADVALAEDVWRASAPPES